MPTHHCKAARHRTPSGLVLLEMLLALALISALWICALTLPRTLSALDHSIMDAARWHARAHAALQAVHDDLATGPLPESEDPSRGVRLALDSNLLQLRTMRATATGADVPVWITYQFNEPATALIRTEKVGSTNPLARTLIDNVASWEARQANGRLTLTLISRDGRAHARSVTTSSTHTTPPAAGDAQ